MRNIRLTHFSLTINSCSTLVLALKNVTENECSVATSFQLSFTFDSYGSPFSPTYIKEIVYETIMEFLHCFV